MKDVLHDCAMAILRACDSVLMCHRHPAREWIPDVWDFPGGHVEPDETPQQALVRELDEELGVTIDAPTAARDEVSTSRRSRYGSPFGSSTTADRWRTAVRRNTTMSAGYQSRTRSASAWPIPHTSLSSGAPSAVGGETSFSTTTARNRKRPRPPWRDRPRSPGTRREARTDCSLRAAAARRILSTERRAARSADLAR
jgi:hypothetical protein